MNARDSGQSQVPPGGGQGLPQRQSGPNATGPVTNAAAVRNSSQSSQSRYQEEEKKVLDPAKGKDKKDKDKDKSGILGFFGFGKKDKEKEKEREKELKERQDRARMQNRLIAQQHNTMDPRAMERANNMLD